MITTYKITIRNNKEHVTVNDMFRLLYVEYLRKIEEYSDKQNKIYNNHGELSNQFESSDLYDSIMSTFISRKLFDFLDWKPYVKTVNIYKLNQQIKKLLNLNWSSYYFRQSEIPFREKDHQINILWYLWEHDMYFEDIKKIPRTLRKLTRMVLYFDYYIEKIFESDYKEEEMRIFSNNPKETWNHSYYHDRYGRHRYRSPSYRDLNVAFDNHEFNTRYNSGSTANYILYTMSSGDDSSNQQIYTNTIYQSTAGGTSGTDYYANSTATTGGTSWG